MKPLFIISCPIDTYSGYGARSRDIVKALIELDKFDIKVLPQKWGNTPWGFIQDHWDEWGFLFPHLLPATNQLPKKPEIWAQITVPNEFQPVGHYNIGITAGIETTIVSHEWIEGVNRMDLNLVSSNHAKDVFLNSKFQNQDPKTGKNSSLLEVSKPIEVLFEGANLDVYFPKTSTFDLDQVEESFAYLFVGHWMEGVIGEDRKNVGKLLECFFNTFKNKKKTPALILKTSGAGCSYMDRETILDKIHQVKSVIKGAKTLPNVYLIHGELTDREMNELYNHKKVKAMVSLTKGEGFGRPLLEFSLTKKPILTTNWSGHTDFLNPEFTTLISSGQLTPVHPSASNKFLLPNSEWFSANPKEVNYYLDHMFKIYAHYKEKANRQAFKSKSEFSFKLMKDKLEAYLNNALPKFASQIELELPQLDLNQLENA